MVASLADQAAAKARHEAFEKIVSKQREEMVNKAIAHEIQFNVRGVFLSVFPCFVFWGGEGLQKIGVRLIVLRANTHKNRQRPYTI